MCACACVCVCPFTLINRASAIPNKKRGCSSGTWPQRGTKANRDPNHGQTLARYNHPRTSGTYPRQNDIFGFEVQLFLLPGVLSTFHNLNRKPQRRLYDILPIYQSKAIKSYSKRFSSYIGGLHIYELCLCLQVMLPTNVKTVN